LAQDVEKNIKKESLFFLRVLQMLCASKREQELQILLPLLEITQRIHLIYLKGTFMNITPRKEEGLYTYSLRVGGMIYSFKSGKPQHNIPLTLKEWVHRNLVILFTL
jgi:hypothetical protein